MKALEIMAKSSLFLLGMLLGWYTHVTRHVLYKFCVCGRVCSNVAWKTIHERTSTVINFSEILRILSNVTPTIHSHICLVALFFRLFVYAKITKKLLLTHLYSKLLDFTSDNEKSRKSRTFHEAELKYNFLLRI